MAAVKVLPV